MLTETVKMVCVSSKDVNVTLSRLILVFSAHFSIVAHACKPCKEEG